MESLDEYKTKYWKLLVKENPLFASCRRRRILDCLLHHLLVSSSPPAFSCWSPSYCTQILIQFNLIRTQCTFPQNNGKFNWKLIPKIYMLCLLYSWVKTEEQWSITCGEKRVRKSIITVSHLPGNIQLPWPANKFPTMGGKRKIKEAKILYSYIDYKINQEKMYKCVEPILPKAISSR